MTEIKKLRKLALNLINANLKKIDGRAIRKYYEIAQNGHASKLKALIETINNFNDSRHLDINTDEKRKALKIVDVKKTVKPKEAKQKVVPMTTLYVSGQANAHYSNTNRKGHYIKPYDFNVKITIPKAQAKIEEIIKARIINEVIATGEISTTDSYAQLDQVTVSGFDLVDGSSFAHTSVTPIENMRMTHANFAKLDIEGLVDYEFTPFKCVYGALKHKYGFEEDQLLSIFQKYIDHQTLDKNEEKIIVSATDGVTSDMLLHLAKLYDFSLYGFDWDMKLFVKHISKHYNKVNHQNHSPFVYVLANNHCYLIDDEEQIQQLTHQHAERSTKTSTTLFREHEKTNSFDLPIFENIDVDKLNTYFNVNVIYSTDNMYGILMQLYETYDYQVSMKNIKLSGYRVIYVFFEEFKLHLYADVNYDEEKGTSWKDIKQICERIDIPFTNQTIQSLMIEYEKKFYGLTHKRVEFSHDEKEMIKDMYDHKCAKCMKEVKKGFQFDHIIPLAAGGTNDIDNMQLLCIECHFEKSRSEQDNGEYINVNSSESSFNTTVKEIITSDLAKSFAFIQYQTKMKYNDMTLMHIDLNKTRRNILMFNDIDLPIFTVMDQVTAFTSSDRIVSGLYYVECENMFPMRGNGWYMSNTINYCIENKLISTTDIKYKVVPSLTVEPDYFKKFLDSVVQNFGDKFGKLGPNAFVGCFNKRGCNQMKMNMTSSEEQALYDFYHNNSMFVRHDKLTNLWITYKENHIEFDESRIPLYKFIVEQEAIEMHKLTKRIQRIGGIVTALNTDCVSAYVPDVKQIEAMINTTFWDTDKKVPKYKLEEKDADHVLIEKMPRLKRTEQYQCNVPQWNIKTDEAIGNDFSNLVEMVINSHQSWFINGPAGSGKSTLAKQIMNKIENKYVALAPTNKACRIINGETIHRFLACAFSNKKALYHKLEDVEYIIIDEISMVKEIFYKVFISLKRMFPTLKFIIIGDFRQLPPVNDRVTVDYEHSAALHELCDGNKVQLTLCRRSDDTLFNMCKSENIENVVADQFNHRFTWRHICFTNKKRIAINDKCMNLYCQDAINDAKQRKKKAPVVVELKKLSYDGNSQDVKLMPGMPVIARVNKKDLQISNNETFTIRDITCNTCTVSDGQRVITFETNNFQKLFYVAFAITTHKSQGESFDHPYTIHEWNCFDSALKYVALSRSRKLEYINIIV